LNAAEPVTLVRSPMLTKVEEEREVTDVPFVSGEIEARGPPSLIAERTALPTIKQPW
jgi:hypothetical protein